MAPNFRQIKPQTNIMSLFIKPKSKLKKKRKKEEKFDPKLDIFDLVWSIQVCTNTMP